MLVQYIHNWLLFSTSFKLVLVFSSVWFPSLPLSLFFLSHFKKNASDLLKFVKDIIHLSEKKTKKTLEKNNLKMNIFVRTKGKFFKSIQF